MSFDTFRYAEIVEFGKEDEIIKCDYHGCGYGREDIFCENEGKTKEH